MTYKVLISEIASKHIENSVEFYSREVNKKVASDFLKDFQKVYKVLQKNPFYRFHDENYRYLPFKKFPFVVFYILDEKEKIIKINAVFHASQSTEKYPK